MNFSLKTSVFTILLVLLASSLARAQSEEVMIKQDSLVTKLMTVKKQIDSTAYAARFFTIQLYYGDNQKAKSILEKFKEDFPDWEVNLSFETPNYKVQVGKYKDYYFGLNKLKEIKRAYPAAFLLEIKN